MDGYWLLPLVIVFFFYSSFFKILYHTEFNSVSVLVLEKKGYNTQYL